MYTECPNCHTFFKVTPAHLKVAGGRVRCGNCSEVFSALESLMEEVPASALERGKNSRDVKNNSAITAYEQDVEILDEKDGSFADIDVPGINDLSDVGDSSLSGLAGDSISAELESSSLSDLTSLSSHDENIVDSIISALEEEGANGSLSSLSSIDELEQESTLSAIDSSHQSAIGREDVAESHVARANMSEINRDIDNALDGLFDEDVDIDIVSKPVSARSTESASKLLEDSYLTDLPDLDDADVLPELNLQKEYSRKSSFKDFELDLSDDPDFYLEKNSSKRNSSASMKATESGSLDNFELDDNLLNSATLDIDDSDWSPATKSGENSEVYSGDSFILEEIDDDKKEQTKHGYSKILWISIICILILVLGGQFIYLKRETLVKYPQIAAILDLECQLIGNFVPCEVPERRATDLVELMDRNIVSHPNTEKALLITATIKNNAEFDQPYPDMLLTFSDINQKIVAKRMFKPEEYLAKGIVISDGMRSGLPIKVILEIVDPGQEAVNFQFDFK